ncbi:MAG TPA: arginine deiminase family protein [Steroidobacteraceae bacterium]|nr:arginine deiminase family protein [Steroidobacteraceae bacterium]
MLSACYHARAMLALIRDISPAMARCELTFRSRVAIDVALAERQHADYASHLQRLGCRLVTVDPEPELPDSVFVEDTVVAVDEIAVMTRPGAAERRRELASVARAIEVYRRLAAIESPATLDGGDVLRIGRHVYVGRSARTNDAGIAQLAQALAPFGYRVTPVEVTGCLHLKSAVTQVGPGTLLINDAWVDRQHFAGMTLISVDPDEPHAANALYVQSAVLHPASAVRTRARLHEAGIEVLPVDVSEIEKAEGGVTCCSVLLDSVSPGTR